MFSQKFNLHMEFLTLVNAFAVVCTSLLKWHVVIITQFEGSDRFVFEIGIIVRNFLKWLMVGVSLSPPLSFNLLRLSFNLPLKW